MSLSIEENQSSLSDRNLSTMWPVCLLKTNESYRNMISEKIRSRPEREKILLKRAMEWSITDTGAGIGTSGCICFSRKLLRYWCEDSYMGYYRTCRTGIVS